MNIVAEDSRPLRQEALKHLKESIQMSGWLEGKQIVLRRMTPEETQTIKQSEEWKQRNGSRSETSNVDGELFYIVDGNHR